MATTGTTDVRVRDALVERLFGATTSALEADVGWGQGFSAVAIARAYPLTPA